MLSSLRATRTRGLSGRSRYPPRVRAPASSAPGSSVRCTRARHGWPARRSPASPPRRPSARARRPPGSAPSARTRRPRTWSPPTTSTSSTSARPTPRTPRSPRGRSSTASTSCARSRSRSSTAEADGLVAALGAAGRVGTVPFVYRFHPVVREARARVRSGSLGPVRLITGGYLQDWLASAEDDNWRVDAAQGGPSRAFADIGSHWCDLAEFITGERIAAICAQTVDGLRRARRRRRRPRLRGPRRQHGRRPARGDHRGRGHGRLPHGFRRPWHAGGLPGLARPQEPPAPRDRLRRGERALRAGAPRDALAGPPRHVRRSSRATRARSVPRLRATPSRRPVIRRATSTVSTFSSRTRTLPCAAGRRRRGFQRSRTARGART